LSKIIVSLFWRLLNLAGVDFDFIEGVCYLKIISLSSDSDSESWPNILVKAFYISLSFSFAGVVTTGFSKVTSGNY